MFPAFSIVFSAILGPALLIATYRRLAMSAAFLDTSHIPNSSPHSGTSDTRKLDLSPQSSHYRSRPPWRSRWVVLASAGLSLGWAAGIAAGVVPLEGRALTTLRGLAGLVGIAATLTAVRISGLRPRFPAACNRALAVARLAWLAIPAVTVRAGTGCSLVIASFSGPDLAETLKACVLAIAAATVASVIFYRLKPHRMIVAVTLSGIGAWSVGALTSVSGLLRPVQYLNPIADLVYRIGDAGSASIASLPASLSSAYLGLVPRWLPVTAVSFVAMFAIVWTTWKPAPAETSET